MGAYRVHGPNAWVDAYRQMSDPAAHVKRYAHDCVLEISGKFVFDFARESIFAMQELIRSSNVSGIVRTFQGDKLVGVVMSQKTNPIQVLRVFPVKTGSTPEEYRQIANEDRIAALIARCELQQPTMQEMDEILLEMWNGTDAANWTD